MAMINPATHRGALSVAASVTLLLCLPLVSFADPPPGCYDSVDTTDSATLRTTLHAVIDDHQRFPYTSGSTDTWDILNQANEDPNDAGNILDVYRNASYPKISGGVRDYNREHTWPKSYGFPDNTSDNYPYTDCHMLFLCDGGYNSSRSNNPYRDCHGGCLEKTTNENNGQGGGSGVYPGNSNWRTGSGSTGTWETWIGRRGDVARAMFYFDVRYEGGTHGETGHDVWVRARRGEQPDGTLVVVGGRRAKRDGVLGARVETLFQRVGQRGVRHLGLEPGREGIDQQHHLAGIAFAHRHAATERERPPSWQRPPGAETQ